MAQQASNAQQREPSMDEILASIRRIIEESEPERASADLSAIEQMTSGPTAMGPAANDVARLAVPQVEDFDTIDAVSSVELPQPLLDDPFAGLSALDAGIRTEARFRSESFDIEALTIDSELEAAFNDAEEDSFIEPAVEAQDTSAVAQTDPFTLAMNEAIGAPAVNRPKPILSEVVGRQVAASFGDLAEAFATNRNRRLDEVAEDMLRPMLQEWLDNNLPVLVERLVREEIERVARGS